MVEVINKTISSLEYKDELEKHIARNHFIWTVLCCYRYGMLYNRQDLMRLATGVMEDIVKHQSPEGTWLEGGSPVIKYAEVSTAAVSLFEHFTGNKKLQVAVEKCLDYTLNTIYPDFSKIGCIDGRNRHTRDISPYTAPTYYKYEGGIAYLSEWSRYFDEVVKFDGQDRTAATIMTSILSALPEEIPYVQENVNKYVPARTLYPNLKTSIIRESPWTIPLCCLEQKLFDSRWVLHRQNLFSIFHEKHGLIIGGGHSISQPQFSCFNVITGGKSYYMYEEGQLMAVDDGMQLVYGGRECNITISKMDQNELVIEYAVEKLHETDRVYVNIPLYGGLGSSITINEKEMIWEKQFMASEIFANESFVYKGLSLSISEDAVFNYPVFPYNTHNRKQFKNYNEVYGIVTIELDYNKPSFMLKISE